MIRKSRRNSEQTRHYPIFVSHRPFHDVLRTKGAEDLDVITKDYGVTAALTDQDNASKAFVHSVESLITDLE